MDRIRATVVALALTAFMSGCEAVPYRIDASEAGLLPPDTALHYLQALPGRSGAVTLRAGHEHCEFAQTGLRVAAANPRYAQKVADELRGELRKMAQEKDGIVREQRRVEQEQRDRQRWMRANGFAALVDDQRRLEETHRSPERWLRARGLPADRLDRDQLERARAGMAREKADLESRMAAVDTAMARQRQALVERIREVEQRESATTRQIEVTLARVHEIATYERAAFVVYRTFRGEMRIDVEYEIPKTRQVDGCGWQLSPDNAATPEAVHRIATALAALGAEGQRGVKAEPPVGSGRRYSASADN